jgi:hypothetical protein
MSTANAVKKRGHIDNFNDPELNEEISVGLEGLKRAGSQLGS